MLIQTTPVEDVITIPQNFAKIISVSGNTPGTREIEYEFRMLVNTTRALSYSAVNLTVAVLSSHPPVPTFTPTSFSPSMFRQSTRRLETSSQSVRSTRESMTLVTSQMDLTSEISNTSASRIAAGGRSSLPSAGTTAPTAPGAATSLMGGAYSESATTTLTVSASAPVSSTRFSLPFGHFSIAPEIERSLSSFAASLVRSTIDPGALTPSLFTSMDQPTAEAAHSMMYTPTITEVQPKAFQIKTEIKQVTKRLTISESVLASYPSFVLEIILKNSVGVETAKETEVVSHSRLLNEFLTPTEAPTLDASQVANGNISLGVRQVDTKATSIRVFRRLAPKTSSTESTSLSLLGTSYSWTKIMDTELDINDGELRFVDEVATSSPLMYRALSVGANSKTAEKFASKVILPRQRIVTIGGTSGCCSATYDYAGKTATITISDIPKKVISVALKRYDVTFNSYATKQAGLGPGFKWVGEKPSDQMILVAGTSEVSFKDPTVKFGMAYRYVPVLILKKGKEEVGRPALLDIPLSPSDDEKVNLTVGTPTILESGQGRSVSFSVGGEFTDFGFGEIKSLLDAGGQAGLFDDQLQENRGQFADLLSYVVERENLSTGDVESFGSMQAGTFTDSSSTRASANVKDIELGTRYAYSVGISVQSAESLLDTLETSEIDTQTLQKFKRNVSKFRGPLQLRQSTLKSTQGQLSPATPSRLTSTDPIVAGMTTVTATAELSVPSAPTSSSTILIEERSDNATLKWAYAGDISSIDHFQVYIASDGGRELVGTLHNDMTTSNFSYRHFTEGFSQDYSYEVVPISVSFEELPSITSKNVTPTLLSTLSPVQFSSATVIQK